MKEVEDNMKEGKACWKTKKTQFTKTQHVMIKLKNAKRIRYKLNGKQSHNLH